MNIGDSAAFRPLPIAYQESLDQLEQGLSVCDANLTLILFNRRFMELLDFPPELARIGTPFEEFIRYNAKRGEYGLGDVETQVRERVALALQFKPHIFERTTKSGRVLRIEGHPLPSGGFITTYTDITEQRQAEDLRRISEGRLHAVINATPDAIITFDADGIVQSWNPGACHVLGHDEEEMLGKPLISIVPEDQRPLHTLWLLKLRNPQGRIRMVGKLVEAIVARKDGQTVPIEFTIGQWQSDGRDYFCAIIRDISYRKKILGKLRQLSQAVEQSSASVMITDTEGAIQYVNPKFEQVSGYTTEEVVGRKPSLLKSGRTAPEQYAELWSAIRTGREWRGELLNRRKNGDLYWEYVAISPIRDSDGRVTHFLAIKEDISVRKEYEERLLRQANFDTLTGLPNRLLAMDRLNQAVAHAHRYQTMVALMLLDLDDFKKVNDTLGHAAGDRLLKEAAHRLTECLREGDTVARLGGDEFVIILPDLKDITSAEIVAEKILEVCAQPFVLAEGEVFIAGSIGIALYPQDERDSQLLMRNADAAMYRAKKEGRGIFRFFTPEMNVQAMEHMRMEVQLRHALERNELSLHYQPLIDNASGGLVGAEALLRWTNPALGSVPPDHFIPLAEDTGLILPIGEWVLREACKEASRWPKVEGRALFVAVNVSSRQFQKRTLVETVRRALAESGLPASCLEIEITESLLLEDSRETHQIIAELNALGIGFAIDDFGTGFSSISYLRRYPFDTLKIDRSFVRDLTTSAGDAELVRSIIAMAQSMRLRIVGEGVETPSQQAFLSEAGCQFSQGWLHSKALPADEFGRYLETRLT
ncbi:MAG: EAL domain-containing protein [Rhodospirillales bacterium]|nr:EAL domain-containing protein [Rhodospirillales bacterium]